MAVSKTLELAVVVRVRDAATKALKQVSKETEGFRSKLLVDTSTESIEEMSDQIKEMSERLPVDIHELTAALYQVRSAGIDASSAMSVLEASGKLAVAGLGTVEEATDILTSAINVFTEQGYSANEMANILFKTVKAGKTTVRELAMSFGMVAPIAGEIGVKFTELQAATAALTTTGMKASVAQTQLRAALAGLMGTNKELLNAYKKLEVASGKELIATYGLVGGFRKLKEALGGNETMLKKAIGSIEGLNAIMFLTSTGAEDFNEILEDMENNVDDLTVAFEKQKNTAAAQYQLFKNQLNVVLIDLGRRILPFLIEAMQWFASALNDVDMSTNYLINRLEKFWLYLGKIWAQLTKDEEQVKIFEEAMRLADEELDRMAQSWAKTNQELEIIKKGLEESRQNFENFKETVKETGEESEEAFKKAVSVVKDLRQEIEDAYQEIANIAKEYGEKEANIKADYEEEIVKVVAEAEQEIKELKRRLTEAKLEEDKREVESLRTQIAEKEEMIKYFTSKYKHLEDDLAEHKRYLAMNEIQKLEFDMEKKLLLAKKEYLEKTIIATQELIDKIKKHKLAIEMIGTEKREAINAEIEKSKTFKEKLEEKSQALSGWVNTTIWKYKNLVSEINQQIEKINPPLPFSKVGKSEASYQFGTTYVPRTGLYLLHRGEAVVPASRGGMGGLVINITGNTFLGEREAAERIGEMIISSLKYRTKL